MQNEKIRIAVFSIIGPLDGGAFQYSLALMKALASLDPNKYEITLWYQQKEWQEIANELGFQAYNNSSYIVPQELSDKYLGLYQKLQLEDTTEEEKKEILNILEPYLAYNLIPRYQAHLLITPHQGCGYFLEDTPSIYVVHDLMHRYQTAFPEIADAQNIVGREFNNEHLISMAELVLVDSKLGKEQVIECYNSPEEKIKILAFTAFEDILTCTPQKPDAYLPEKFFFYPAQFWSHKNHKNIALAVEIMRKENPDIHFVFTGDIHKNGYADFIQVVEAFDLQEHFTILGYKSTEEIAWLYKNARALIYPTYAGPTNIPPLEAMALACPCAVSDIFAMQEQCGEAALYFNPAATFSLLKAMKKLWTDDELCEKLRQNGLARCQSYTIQDFNLRFLNYVDELLNKHYPNLIK